MDTAKLQEHDRRIAMLETSLQSAVEDIQTSSSDMRDATHRLVSLVERMESSQVTLRDHEGRLREVERAQYLRAMHDDRLTRAEADIKSLTESQAATRGDIKKYGVFVSVAQAVAIASVIAMVV